MTGGPDTRRDLWIPWTFVGLFGVVLLANGLLAWFALESWSGLTTDNAYERGLAWNQVLEEAGAQRVMGWTVELDVEPAAGNASRITVAMRDRLDAPLEGARVTALFSRPVVEGLDSTVALEALGEGRYGNLVELPQAGQWDVRIEVEQRGRTWQGLWRFRTRQTPPE